MDGLNPIIDIRKLTAWYEDRLILDDINLQIYPGEIFFIAGGSGSGKTTLLRCIVGLHQNISGKIFVDGDDMITTSSENKLQILRKIGIAYQSNALFGSMSILENVMFPLEELSTIPKEAIKTIAERKLAMVGLADFCDYFPAELSGGMQKRAAIARALALEPEIIFLDEPTAGLDPITSVQIDNLILLLSTTLKITFVIVSHELSSIYNIGKRVAILNENRIVALGEPKELYNNCNVEYVKYFLGRRNHEGPTTN